MKLSDFYGDLAHLLPGCPYYVLDNALKNTARRVCIIEGEGVDDESFERYKDEIIHGTLARLLLSPRKPYTDVQLGKYHSDIFLSKTGGTVNE